MEKANVGFNGYLPNGLKVFYTFPLDTLADMVTLAGHLGNVVALTDVMIAQGFALQQPGLEALEPGEHRESVNAVLRRKFMEDDGTIVPVIDIYPDNPALGRRCVFYYLNDDKQIAEFEAATGLKLTDLPVFDDAQLNRVEKPELAKKFLRPINGTVSVVFKDNPAYDANAAKKKAKHIFVRWESTVAVTPAPTPPQTSQPAIPPAGKPEVEATHSYLTALNNELVTVIHVEKGDSVQNANDNYRGYTYNAGATFTDAEGSTTAFPLKLWPEDVNAIKKAGYPFPDAGGDCKIPVVLNVSPAGPARINLKALTSAAAGVVEGDYKPNWSVIYPKVKYLYDNTKHMGKSVQALFKEGAFANCKQDADAISIIVQHKNGFAEKAAS